MGNVRGVAVRGQTGHRSVADSEKSGALPRAAGRGAGDDFESNADLFLPADERSIDRGRPRAERTQGDLWRGGAESAASARLAS
ncbi:hypothetical protein D1872_244880 [compost metagenome]